MPITSRSTTSPTRKMVPAKRPYDEMTSDEDSDSDYYPEEIRESLIEEIEELKEMLEISKNTENGLIDALVEEREKTRELETEMNDWINKYSEISEKYNESQTGSYYTYIVILTLVILNVSIPLIVCY